MRSSAVLSALFHIAIIGLAMTTFARQSQYEFDTPANIPVELLTVSDVTNVSAAIEETEEEPPLEEEVVEEQEPEPEPEPQQTAALPDPVIEAPEPEAEFLPEEDAEPEPEPEEVEAEPEPEPEVAAPPPSARPNVRPQPPERRNEFDFAAAEALIDRTPREEEPEFDLENLDIGEDTNVQTAERSRSAVGLGTGLTMSQQDALKADIQRCWNVPAGARDAENLLIELRVHFNQDGTVRRVEVMDSVRYNSDSFYRAAADSARRAVERCQTGTRFDGSFRQGYDLPPEQYDTWRTVRLTFDPRDML